jgi:glycosyltransferase involved in cell wall biosynthesis
MNPKVSVVAPVYNEEDCLSEFISQVIFELEKISIPFEIVICNDGSQDGTKLLLAKICEDDSRVKKINLSRNFGQHAAITAGIYASIGEYTIVMDSDMQDDPSVISKLLHKAESGYDIVFVARTNRKVSGLYSLLQRIFYFFLNMVSDLTFDPRFGNFSIISKKVRKAYIDLNGSIRYYPAALNWLGFATSIVFCEQRARKSETKTKYNFFSRLRLAFQVIVAHSRKPLKLAVVLGFFIATVGFLLSFWVLWLHLNDSLTQPGWASTIVAIISLSGLQLFTLGIFGLYIGEIFDSTQKKPQFIIEPQ